MKKILLLAMIALSATAASFADDIDDIFIPGDGEFKFERFSNEEILLSIDRDAKVACRSNGQCTLSSVQSDSKGWEVSFNVGEGNSSGNSGTTIITGGGYDSGKNGCDSCGINWGVTLSYHKGTCTQQVMVPRSLYYSMNRYLYGLMQETGETRKGFTPADEAMIMFYSTIMKQASSGGCGGGK